MKDDCRHEYKYLISRASAELLKRRLPHIMRPDPHVGPTGRYTIRSLYFDDPCLSAYDEKIDGLHDRVKYRIRCYDQETSFLKLEKKEKHGSLTKKTAQTISRDQAQCLQKGCLLPSEGLVEELRQELRLRPVVLVDYDRTPFVYPAGNTRVTIDEALRTRPVCTDLFASYHAMLPVLPPDQVILEVKFDDLLPRHLADALADIPKHAMAISKYALCLEVSRLI